MGPYNGAGTNSGAFVVGGAHVPMKYYVWGIKSKEE